MREESCYWQQTWPPPPREPEASSTTSLLPTMHHHYHHYHHYRHHRHHHHQHHHHHHYHHLFANRSSIINRLMRISNLLRRLTWQTRPEAPYLSPFLGHERIANDLPSLASAISFDVRTSCLSNCTFACLLIYRFQLVAYIVACRFSGTVIFSENYHHFDRGK